MSKYNFGPQQWTIGYRFIFPMYPFIFIVISLFIVKLLSRKNKILRYTGSSILITVISIGIFSNINLITLDNWNLGNDSLYKPYNYELFADWLGHSCSIEKLSCKDRCNKLTAEHIPYCYRSIGKVIASKLKFKYNKNIKECEELGDKKEYCYLGLGFGTRENLNMDLSIQKCNNLDTKNRIYCYKD